MAEGKREEDPEGLPGGRALLRSRSATDRTERNKPEHLHSSPGPLSSIKAAFKRTSVRSHSQGEGGRERRRPEITILSVEPLPTTTWFPGASGGFPAHAPSSQPVWDGGIHISDQQPPPSYDQVIKEKTQEKVVTPTAPPRRSHTNTAATQTDCVEEERSHAAQCTRATVSSVGKPKKPPRPTPPKPPPGNAPGPTVGPDPAADTDTATLQPNSTEPSPRPRPVPRPRSKLKPADQLQALIRLQDSSDGDPVTSQENELHPSGTYSKELLEAFDCDPEFTLQGTEENQENQSPQFEENLTENMNGHHSDRNIRARIQAFESQNDTSEANAPLARPRNIYSKLPIGPAKPFLAPRPSLSKKPAEKQPAETAEDYYEEVNISPMPPPLAPKPQLPRKPSFSPKEVPKLQPLVKSALLPPRPSLVRSKTLDSQEGDSVGLFKGPPPPLKPNIDLLNINNHNSTALLNTAQTLATVGNEYTDSPISQTPIKPARGGGLSSVASNAQNVIRRPTVIRVPSKSQDEAFDFPPPLPVQKAVGGLIPPPKPTHKESFRSAADLSLPPRRSGGKVPPPRPPPAKTGPARPPPPRSNSVHLPVSHKEDSPRYSPQPLHKQSRKSQKKGPVLPPRPNPGHCLYNTYTLEVPHGVAEFNYNGTRTGELSFQKNEVLVLLNQIDSKTFECQVGDAKGTVEKSHMKIITPLTTSYNNNSSHSQATVQERSSDQAFGHAVENGTVEVQALFDFTPEGPGELALRTGDVVTNVEQVDSEWYLGVCRGMTGFFPINYVIPMKQSGPPAPAPASVRKVQPAPETVKGPRCVARFDFEGDDSSELSFSEGDVIRLCEYVDEEWARGELGGRAGIFPLNFVDVLEDLPPSAEQNHTRIPLPGMAASPSVQTTPTSAQVEGGAVEWAEALYDFNPEADDELAFVQGDMILVTDHLDSEWSSGRLNGREGIFPTAFVHTC
ncbi:SH3 domain-containing protein 19 [Astyanax mexicanus]|uniref:SH3 domain-containing protein 19 n=1 Tax=Astyanax mexicanus TaxID=7994 RepID=UPI0020CAA268|nr:SH3 domain-containing protein 19 [Astyanax mexicanus]